MKEQRKGLPAQEYASRYSGRGKIERLRYAAAATSDTGLAKQALREAAEELKRATLDTRAYRAVVEELRNAGEEEVEVDEQWVKWAEDQYKEEHRRLETELTHYRSSTIKDSIRLAYQALGNLQWRRGELTEAARCYTRMRDYITAAKHTVDMCTKVMVVNCLAGTSASAHNQSTRARAKGAVESIEDQREVARVRVASGVSELASGHIKAAAEELLAAPFALDGSLQELASDEDVGAYGLFCALATLPREELLTKCVRSKAFRQFLDSWPSLREAADRFAEADFRGALSLFEREGERLKLDMFVGSRVNELLSLIRSRALFLLALPYSRVPLSTLAACVNAGAEYVEEELTGYISRGQLRARIDAAQGVLHACPEDSRSKALAAALSAGESFAEEQQAMLLRSSLLSNHLIVRQLPSE